MGKKIVYVVSETYVLLENNSISTYTYGVFDSFNEAAELMDSLFKEQEDSGVIITSSKNVCGWDIKTKYFVICTEVQSLYMDVNSEIS